MVLDAIPADDPRSPLARAVRWDEVRGLVHSARRQDLSSTMLRALTSSATHFRTRLNEDRGTRCHRPNGDSGQNAHMSVAPCGGLEAPGQQIHPSNQGGGS